MPTLTSGGIGSGIDVAGLVNSLINAERAPTEGRLAVKEAGLQARLSGFGLIKGALDKLQSAVTTLGASDLLSTNKASSGDDKLFTASADGTAVAGAYSVEITTLAAAQKLASGAFAASTTVVGTGSLTLALAGKTATLTIDDSNKSLAGIRDAINAARTEDGTPLGITATLVTSTGGVEPAGTYLVLTSSTTGASNTISVTQAGGDGGLAALQYETGGLANGLTEKQAAADSVVKVDGFTYTSASNTVSGVLAGVTLNLKATTTAPVTLTVTSDVSGVQPKLQAVVDAYNALVDVLKQQGGYNSAVKSGGPLLGDSVLRNVSGQLRLALTGRAEIETGAPALARDIGIGIDASGKLKLDAATLKTQLAQDRTAVEGVLGGDTGLIKRLSNVLEGYLGSTGVLKARTDSIGRQLVDITDQRGALSLRLEALEKRYLAQFNALDGLLSKIQATGSFLSQQLANLPGAFSGDKR